MNICLIPAREGSKRIKNKNILIFNKRPLISWSIKVGKKSKLFKNIFVSTDSKKISKIAEKYGAEIPYLRPKYLANDYANDLDVINHFLKFLKKKKIIIKYLFYLYPAAPLLTISTIKKMRRLLLNKNCSRVLAISEYQTPIQKALDVKKNNEVISLKKNFSQKRSQDLKKYYHDVGQCYWYKIENYKIKKYNNKIKSFGFYVNKYSAHDIDDQLDFKYLKKLYKAKF